MVIDGGAGDGAATVGALLRTARKAALLTQEQLAERANVSVRTIRALERNQEHRPTLATVRLLVDALELEGPARKRLVAAAQSPPARPAGVVTSPGCQLPMDIPDLTGRREKVRLVRDALVRGGDHARVVAISAIAGMGGIGKTALAIHVAHGLRSRFPDGQLFVNLRGAEHTPADPAQVLENFLQALGVPGSAVPEGVEERAKRYRSLLADRRILVVLDNAAHERQVEPLLPGNPACGVIVTSRTRLTGLPGVRPVELDVLGTGQAIELLTRILGADRVAAEPAAARDLVELCGRLPLALRVAGAKLAARPHWPLARFVEELADERRRLDRLSHGELDVRASVALSYQRLDPTARRLFRRLGLLHAADFAAWVGAALLDAEEGEAEDAMERLADARLVEAMGPDPAGQLRFRFHDLIGAFARERVGDEEAPEEREAALARAFGCWLHLAERAAAALDSPYARTMYGDAPRYRLGLDTTGELLREPLMWLEAERAALVTAVAQAAALGMPGLAWELTSAVEVFIDMREHLDDRRHCVRVALRAARDAGDRRGEAAMLTSRGILDLIEWDLDAGMRSYQAAHDRFADLGDDYGRGVCLVGMSSVHRRKKTQGDLAERCAEAALAIFRDLDNACARANALRILGRAHAARQRPDRARDCFEESLRLYCQIGNVRGEGYALAQLGTFHLQQGQAGEALPLLRRAHRMLDAAGDHSSSEPVRRRLGEALLGTGRHAEARLELEDCLRSFRSTGVVPQQIQTLHALARLEWIEGHHPEAVTRLREALTLSRELGLPADEARTLKMLESVGDAAASAGASERPEGGARADPTPASR